MLSKTVHNDPAAVVDEALQGLLLMRPDLELLSPAHYRVIARRAIPESKVALVCGGGAGHEPAHAGYVGTGMLTAAVTGGIFASPTVPAVERALLHVTTAPDHPGVLLLVKNYTGDRLAFSAAAEKTRALGRKVETVFVCDDAALEGGACIGRRGLAGTVLVYKIAGALAEQGAPLDVVAACARAAAARVHTYGASLTVCEIPGRVPSERLAGEAMELGLGIHGEPGATRLERTPPASELCGTMLAACLARLCAAEAAAGDSLPSPAPCALLVNNYGGLSQLELGVVVRSAVAWLEKEPPPPSPLSPQPVRLVLQRLIAGTCMSSLGMRGFSLSLLPLWPTQGTASGSTTTEALLDQAVGCGSAWPGCVALLPGHASVSLAPPPAALPACAPPQGALAAYLANPSNPQLLAPGQPAGVQPQAAPAMDAALAASYSLPLHPDTAALVLACLEAAGAALIAAEAHLNALDAKVGDGDTGSTFAHMARAALGAAVPHLRAVASPHPPTRSAAVQALSHKSLRPLLTALLLQVGDAVAEACGGSSGLLYTLLLRAAAQEVSPRSTCAHFAGLHRQADGSDRSLAMGTRSTSVQVSINPSTSEMLSVYALAFSRALHTLGAAANSREGQRSMLDALHPAVKSLSLHARGGGESLFTAIHDSVRATPAVLDALAAAVQAGAAATAGMAPRAGRSCWVTPEVAQGVQDPGAAAAAVWVSAIAAKLKSLVAGAEENEAAAREALAE